MTVILLGTGDQLEVNASVEEVVKELHNAARSSAGTFARLSRSDDEEPIALNTAHVVLIREGGD